MLVEGENVLNLLPIGSTTLVSEAHILLMEKKQVFFSFLQIYLFFSSHQLNNQHQVLLAILMVSS